MPISSVLFLFCLLGHGSFYTCVDCKDSGQETFHNAYNAHQQHGFLGIDRVHSRNSKTQCNLFPGGTWIHDTTYPLYNAGECPYISTQINCRPNGRPDSDYEKWRWQPDGCSVPRFNARDMLQRLRGKRLLYVGDCISRSHFQSMLCLLRTVLPPNKISFATSSGFTKFKALDYNASVELFWAPFLVELETTKQGKKILHLDSIENYGKYWKGADILVFESSHWWPDRPGTDIRWDIIMEGNKTLGDIDPMVAYRKALTTWAVWTYSNIDPQKSFIFFRSMSLRHSRCANVKEPVQNPGTNDPSMPPQVSVLHDFLNSNTKFRLILMNITRMTGLRKDAHPSVYGSKQGDEIEIGDEEARDPGDEVEGGDCSHWCLPGVPDSWNDLLYAYLVIAMPEG